MKVIVTVKRVVDPYAKIRVKEDKSGVETASMKMATNPFDEIALEEAIRLREKNTVTEVVALTIGSDTSLETLRHALALGADRAILVKTSQSFCSLNIAKIIKKIVEQEEPQLVLMGKQAIDGDNNQTSQMVSALLDWSLATFASAISVEGENVLVTREVDGGLETLRLPLPTIVSVDLRLNEPRYASLPNIMKAKSKPVSIIELEGLNLELKQHRQIISVEPPVSRKGGILVDSVEALVEKLKYEAKVL